MTLIMNRILATLLMVSTAAVAVAVDDASADYESKIKAALENYAAHSDEILQRAIEVGNNDGAAAIDNVEIDANGEIKSLSYSSEVYADFGLKAVNAQLHKIHKLVEQKVGSYDRYEEVFRELSGAGGTTITYEQLEEWGDMAEMKDVLNEGEVYSLWQRAIGSKSAVMNLPQFVKFNDLLDNLVMAKANFMKLTKGKVEGQISYHQLWHMDPISDNTPEKAFFELWKKALGEDVAKGVMNYEQFLVFWELADEWLELDDIQENDSDDEDDDDEDVSLNYHGLGARKSGYMIADEDLSDEIRADLESEDEDIRNEAMFRRQLDPDRWDKFSYWEIYGYFACDKRMSSPRPLWTDQQWRDVRDFYHEFVEEDMKEENSPEDVHSYQFSEEEYDLTQNAIPVQAGEKGRGLQAVRDIKAGELVFKATNNTIVFNYGHTWRKMLFAFHERFADPGLTCDLHVWSWVQDLYDGGPMKVVMDLDSGSLLNEGRDEPGWDPPNVQCGRPDATRCDMDYYAFRDIKEGDELLIDYNEFAWLDSWPDMGL